ncbi:hypothetical protein GCM10011609_07480 [Lentzea pudingi]|uniref:Serine/threonine protein kinase n=1 Tax=Lentzea pudingi TaxID=1789439 RepID=A0ABQ2HB90_9PSEU|nr:hypothetical protein [Lentzea pudingi]GGM74187.1 hypothetical protein GCM10011609_07480 [Lentzea pudingi]
MTHSDQETDNGIEGNVSTAFQAGSMAITLGAPAKPVRGRAFWGATAAVSVLAVAGVSTLAMKLIAPGEPGREMPAAVTSPNSVEAAATSSPAPAVLPVTTTTAGRPAAIVTTARPTVNAPAVVPPVVTTTAAKAATLPPVPTGDGVRFSGTVPFGSYNLDLAEPRGMDGMNVWPLTPGRLHGDENYLLAEWTGDGTPGRDECAADIARRGTRDAVNLIAGSRVCGRTPGGRTFLVEVSAVDTTTITGRVTVWEAA